MYNKFRHVNTNDNIFIRLTYVENDTYMAKVLDNGAIDKNTSALYSTNKDDRGALIYVCVVLVIYGFSIFLMIGSLIKKSMADHGVHSYMKNMDTLRRLERRQAKFKARLAIQNKKAKNNYRFDRAIFGGSGKSNPNGDVLNPYLDNLCSDEVTVMIDTISNDSPKPKKHLNRSSSITLPIQTNVETRCELFAKQRNISTGCEFDEKAEEITAFVPVFTIGTTHMEIQEDCCPATSAAQFSTPQKIGNQQDSTNTKVRDSKPDEAIDVDCLINSEQFSRKSPITVLQLQPLLEDEVATFV